MQFHMMMLRDILGKIAWVRYDFLSQGKISDISYPKCMKCFYNPGCVVQSVTCLTADPGVANSIPAQSHTFMEIDYEIISTTILLPSADSRRVVKKK